jgi:LDH2 family malate/lactate/ureidoglycolate dehydrogenase
MTTNQYRRITKESLFLAVKAIFLNLDVSEEDAETAADVLVKTDLRGVESHGVSNMLESYIHEYSTKELNPKAKFSIVNETASIANIDGDLGLGIIQGPKFMQLAIEKAKETGVGVISVSRSGHLGAIGHHALLATEQDMIGYCLTTNNPLMIPPDSSEALIGTNPIALAAPTLKMPTFLYDASTTATAYNKIMNFIRQKKPVPPGLIPDDNGVPIMHESIVEGDDFSLLPLGSIKATGSYKGFGLALIPEILSTFLSGAVPFLFDPNSLYKHFFCAYNISSFTDVPAFKENLDNYLQRIMDSKKTEGSDSVHYPGYPEFLAEKDRTLNGIPLHIEVIEWFKQYSSNKGLPKLEIHDV